MAGSATSYASGTLGESLEPRKASVVRGKKLLFPSQNASQGQIGITWSVLGATRCGVLHGISPL